MKVAIECQSPLLQRSLEQFLAPYLSTIKQCDVVVSDKQSTFSKPMLFISSKSDADLVKPFSKSQLMLALEKKLHNQKEIRNIQHMVAEGDASDEDAVKESHYEGSGDDFEMLRRRIEALTLEYQNNILRAVRAFYEK